MGLGRASYTYNTLEALLTFLAGHCLALGRPDIGGMLTLRPTRLDSPPVYAHLKNYTVFEDGEQRIA